MKSTYEIEREMERKFGKDFIDKMNSQKEEFERLEKELEEAKSFEEKVNEKTNELRKKFMWLTDNNIYPMETCSSQLYVYAKRCVEENLSKKECAELRKEYEFKVIEDLQEEIDRLQLELNQHKEAWSDEK